MPNPRVAHCVFCDDVRQEVGNKLSLMGMYMGDIVLPVAPPVGMPAILPKFAICVWLLCDWGDNPERITVRVYAPPGRTEITKMEAAQGQIAPPAPLFDDPTKLSLTTLLPIFNFAIFDEGEIEVTVETEQGTLRAGRLQVRMPSRHIQSDDSSVPSSATSDSSAASPSPSEQSPTVALDTKPTRPARRPSTRRTARTPE